MVGLWFFTIIDFNFLLSTVQIQFLRQFRNKDKRRKCINYSKYIQLLTPDKMLIMSDPVNPQNLTSGSSVYKPVLFSNFRGRTKKKNEQTAVSIRLYDFSDVKQVGLWQRFTIALESIIPFS